MARQITNGNLEHLVLNDIKEMDMDAFCDLVGYMYGVPCDYDHELETFKVSAPKGLTLEDIFGDNIKLFED